MLVLIRHGQTTFNAEGRLSGRLDVELTDRGRRQADAAAAAVRAIGSPDLIISSPLARARSTALAVGAEMRIDERWIELDYGELDGRPLADVPRELWDSWRANPSFAPPGGESMQLLDARVADACDELATVATDGLVVVVTHVSPIKAAVAWALGVSGSVAWRMFVAPASMTRIAIRNGVPALHGFNEIGHLGG